MIIFNLKEIRKNKNMSIYRLSKLTGLSRTYIRNIENNKKVNPTIKILFDIAKVLDVNIKDLFYTTFDIEDLKQKMYKSIADNGINAKETLEISQLIDLLINIKMKEELDK